MKNKLFKRIGSLVMAVVMMMTAMAIPAFAAEVDTEPVSLEENLVTVQAVEGEGAVVEPRGNTPVVTTVQPWGTTYLYPVMKSYIGLSQTFYVITSSVGSPNGGAIYLELYNPKGEMISYNWSTGINTPDASWKFTLPSSGTYTLKIVSWTDVPVSVTAYWD